MGTVVPNSSGTDVTTALGANVRVHLLDPGAGLIEAAARAILDAASPPDLSRHVVLVADFGAAPGLRAALGRAAAARGFAALFAPRITTLQAWAAEASLEREIMGGARTPGAPVYRAQGPASLRRRRVMGHRAGDSRDL